MAGSNNTIENITSQKYSKKEALLIIKTLVNDYSISVEELQELNLITELKAENKNSKQASSNSKFGSIINIIGGGILTVGCLFLAALYWPDLDYITRILLTTGLGFGLLIIAIILQSFQKLHSLTTGLYIASSILIPIGISYYLTTTFGSNSPDSLDNSIIAHIVSGLILIASFVVIYIIYKPKITVLILYIYSIIEYNLILSRVIQFGSDTYLFTIPVPTYRLWAFCLTLFFGAWLYISYMVISKMQFIQHVISTISLICVIISIFITFSDNILGDILISILIAVLIWLTQKADSRVFTAITMFTILVYLIMINSIYFAGLVSWPIALIIGGLIMILLSYFIFQRKPKA